MLNHEHQSLPDTDILLIGGGIMSATLASVLALLQPHWRITLVERRLEFADESSNAWNNAGTGHCGYCELNYMPDPQNPATAASIAHHFLLTRQWWSYLAEREIIEPSRFISATAHLDVVFGEVDVAYLRQRYLTLASQPYFADLEFSEDRTDIATWAPLVMAGRDESESVAATRIAHGTDVDFGALTRDLIATAESAGATTLRGYEVRGLQRDADGRWIVRGRNRDRRSFAVRARFVFVGAGGKALNLLQRAHTPEVRGYGVLPVGAAFLRCANPAVVERHPVKVYGQAPIGAPPMSVPHLDARVVDGDRYLMFGPYATFSTKLLKHGSWLDFFSTLRPHNVRTLAAAGWQNLELVRYLVKQLTASRAAKFAELQHFYPDADPDDWDLIGAGQRAQLVTPDPVRAGVIQSGTELIVGGDGSIAGLLGASPGASTAVPIMFDLLRRAFPDQWKTQWCTEIERAVPLLTSTDPSAAEVAAALAATARSLGLHSQVRTDRPTTVPDAVSQRRPVPETRD